ncbi:MAG: hypothetical protein KAS32_25110 [Candidatus Peribacteraceae bacterium]|nr:hypothetical protein [Candidatus Peribacteraceae bacterium]
MTDEEMERELAGMESESDTEGPAREWMKAFGQRSVTSGERSGHRVYGGGGLVRFRDENGKKIKMAPGQVRVVPNGVVRRANAYGSKVFVKPGSQKEGDEVREPKPVM